MVFNISQEGGINWVNTVNFTSSGLFLWEMYLPVVLQIWCAILLVDTLKISQKLWMLVYVDELAFHVQW